MTKIQALCLPCHHLTGGHIDAVITKRGQRCTRCDRPAANLRVIGEKK